MNAYPSLLLFSLASLPLIHAAQSSWTILDEMEDPAFPAWTLTLAEGGYGRLTHVSNAFNSDTNALYVDPLWPAAGWTTTCAALPLKSLIADGETGTIYFRYAEENNSREYYYGFSDFEITPDEVGGFSAPVQWNHFEGTIQMVPNSSVLKVRDAGAYRTLTADDGNSGAQIEAKTWYDVWIVITNAFGLNNDEYTVYIRGGDYRVQTLLQVQTESENFNTALFRNGTTDSIKTIFIRIFTGPPDVPYNNDDVYIARVAQASGVELSDPNIFIDCFGYGFQCEWQTDENGDVDTGDWLGWINIQKRPWIYAYSLDSWIWINEANINDQGAWAYIRK